MKSEPSQATSTVSAEDALKYAVALVRERVGWTTDAIAGSCCDQSHEIETDAIWDLRDELAQLTAPFGDPNRYSDGRAVYSSREVDAECGLVTGHIWHPDAGAEEPRSWRGNLHSGYPDVPSPGIFEVSTDPLTQSIHVRVVRVASGSGGL